MDGSSRHINPLNSKLLIMLLLLVAATGCIPVIELNSWPTPRSFKPYLPPEEKEDVLLVCLFDYSDHDGWMADAQILSHPYNNAKLKSSRGLGITSITWGFGSYRRIAELLLFTKKHKAITVPLRPFNAHDDALSYFYVMNNPPLKNEDFYDVDDKTDMPCFRCVSSPGIGYLLKKCTTPEAKYRWISHENAKLAREFWEKGTSAPPSPSGNIWKLHSIFGKTNDILSSRP